MKNLEKSIYDLIVKASTVLPADVKQMINEAKMKENSATRSALALSIIEHNNETADLLMSPLCQDTGMPTFYVTTPVGVSQLEIKTAIYEAVKKATAAAILRPNVVDSLTGVNSGDNIGEGSPIIKFEQSEKEEIEILLLLKGGGCENKNAQYSLPMELPGLGMAGRDLDGVRKCILHAIYEAQGQGCGPGFIGVGIGGDRTSGYELAKKQLFRPLTDTHPVESLAKLENYILDAANTLGIGTMGFGGESTLLACKIGAIHRLPASFFVSVAYNCWAFRRQGIRLDALTGNINNWVYETDETTSLHNLPTQDQEPTDEGVIHLTTPLSEEKVRSLNVGDVVSISGMMYTGRDAIHKHLFTAQTCPVDLKDQIIYHCGPVVTKNGDTYNINAAGPTTSIREEPYQAEVMKKFGNRMVIGKGGMGAKTLAALQSYGGVYVNAIGGAAQYYASTIEQVMAVDFLHLGVPEAMWHLKVSQFKGIVTMDAHGNSLHATVEQTSFEKLEQLKERVF